MAATTTTFRQLHERPGAFIIPNPWDIGSARILASMGLEALATTSGGKYRPNMSFAHVAMPNLVCSRTLVETNLAKARGGGLHSGHGVHRLNYTVVIVHRAQRHGAIARRNTGGGLNVIQQNEVIEYWAGRAGPVGRGFGAVR